MREKVNKPRAFLSYASRDRAFIEKIETDLRTCQIDTWRDSKDIRDGQPWMESIFEEGLPTCDVIVAYFTENSLSSDMVAKEVDAAQIRQLKDSGVSFLPYVRNSEIRTNLRLDIQTRQCRVWNDDNYYEVLPSVVGEIWRSYMERNLAVSLLQERNRRLELEIEVQTLRATPSSVFTAQEEKEFQYVLEKLDAPRKILIRTYDEGTPPTVTASFSFLKCLLSFLNKWSFFDASLFRDHVLSEFQKLFVNHVFSSGEIEDGLIIELRTYGFVRTKDTDDQFVPFLDQFTEKMYRFRFWLEVNHVHGQQPRLDIPTELKTPSSV